jgi:hypothetical protein
MASRRAASSRECGDGSGDHFSPAPGFYQARTEHERGDLIGSEHKRWEIEVATQHITDSGFAFDGLAGELQVAHVAINRALGDLKPLGERASGLQAA